MVGVATANEAWAKTEMRAMAMVMCKTHGLAENGARENAHPVEPLGYPATAAICRSVRCEEPGILWLDADELADYRHGVRVFRVPTDAIKVQAA